MASRLPSTLALSIVTAALAACSAGSPGGDDGSGGSGGDVGVTSNGATTSSGEGGAGSTSSTSSSQSSSSASSSTSASSGTTSSSSTGGGAPIACDDPSHPVTNIAEGECSLLQQNCPSGNTCVPVLDGAAMTTQCQPASGTKSAGTACGGDAECAPGLFCADVCTPTCCPSNSTAPGANEPCGSGSCNLKLGYQGRPEYLMVCSYAPACELLTSGSCPSGMNCYVQGEGVARCGTPTGTNGTNGTACEALNDCAADFVCIDDPSSVCRALCKTDGSTTCPSGTSCQGLQGFTSVGVCAAN